MFLLVGSLLLFISVSMGISGILLIVLGKSLMIEYYLFEFSGCDFSYEVIFDWVSCFYVSVVFLISGSVLIYSEDYMYGDKLKSRFLLLSVLFILSSSLMILSGGIVSMSLGWDGLGLISYCLVIYYQNPSSYKAGMITFSSNRIGDAILLVCIGWLLCEGSWNFFFLSYDLDELFIYVMFVIAACTKSAQVPFSAWLPEAMAAPTPVSSLVHSSTLVTAGVYMSIRLNFLFDELLMSSYALMLMSLSTMLVGGFGALVEMDSKKVVAMSTLSQLGMMMFMLSLGLWMVSYLHSVSHAMFKALMFSCSGVVIHGGGGNQDFRWSGGLMSGGVLVKSGSVISVLCLGGFPFMCGFFSKDLMLEMFLMGEKNIVVMILFILGLSTGVLYSFRMLLGSMVVVDKGVSMNNYGEGNSSSVGIIIMSIISVIGGTLYLWMMNSFIDLIMLSVYLKMGALILFFFGFLFMMMMEYFNSYMKLIMVGHFFCKMWFMSNLSGDLFMNGLFVGGWLIKCDQEWFEIYGGSGVGYFNVLISKLYGYIHVSGLLILFSLFMGLGFLFLL